jgi:hypothetical protein
MPDPRRHLVLAAFDNLSTLIVSREPFSGDDVARLHDVTAQMGFSILVSPDALEPSEVLQQIMAAPRRTMARSMYRSVTPAPAFPLLIRPSYFRSSSRPTMR